MRIPCTFFLLAILAPLCGRPVAAMELFRLVVDPTGPTPFSDGTGRHEITKGAVADVDPGAATVPGSVVPTSAVTPEGSNAALFVGGWLEVSTSNPGFASDFLFAANQNLTLRFWFRSAGNGAYRPTPSVPRYGDRMHAIGLGDGSNNLDVDLGDDDPIAGLAETACWTYFGSDGENYVVDSDPSHDRNHYLDDEWHLYTLVRRSGVVTVYLDGQSLGTRVFADPLGSISIGSHTFLGRASILTGNRVTEDPFPWFGYLGDVRVFDEAIAPAETVPAQSWPGLLALTVSMVLIAVWRLGTKGAPPGRRRTGSGGTALAAHWQEVVQ